MTVTSDGWRVVALGEVARWSSGGTPTAGRADYYGGAIPWAVIGDLNDGLVSATRGSITEKALAESSAKVVPVGAVLIAMYGSIGKLGIAGTEMATNQAIACAVPHAFIEPRYLFHYLASQRDALASAGKGATQKNISQTVLKAWPIPVPPIDEQRRIVDILEDHLSRLDAANDYLAAATRRLRSLETAALRQSIESTPARVPLTELVERVEAGRSFGGSAPPAQPEEWGVIKVSAMTWGEFRQEENKAVPTDRVNPRFEIRAGDLLVSRANTSAYVGASVLVRETRPRLLLSDKSLRLVPREGVDTEWLHLALSAPGSRRQISDSATGTKESMRNISQPSLLAVQLPEATLDQQRAQVQRVRSSQAAFRALVHATTEADARAKVLRRGLLAAAFTGRLTGHSSDLERAEELAFA